MILDVLRGNIKSKFKNQNSKRIFGLIWRSCLKIKKQAVSASTYSSCNGIYTNIRLNAGYDSPGRGCARPPSLRLMPHRGLRKNKKKRFTLFAAPAGERVGQRSVAGVSLRRHSIYAIPFQSVSRDNQQDSVRVLYPYL
jgi:hypothetical protein